MSAIHVFTWARAEDAGYNGKVEGAMYAEELNLISEERAQILGRQDKMDCTGEMPSADDRLSGNKQAGGYRVYNR